MRDLLTGLAIILIVVLTTLLVAPYFVDWNSQRGFLEAQLSRALGQTVTIGGDIDLKLLPTPYLRLNQTVIGGDDGALRIGIRHLDFELAAAALLHGEIDIVEGRLEQPVIRLSLQPDRTLPAIAGPATTRLDVRLERVGIVDGTLAVSDPQSGRTFTADHIDGVIEAPSLSGPFKGAGTVGPGTARTKVRFSATATRGSGGASRTKLRLAIDETAAHPALDLDGDVVLAPAIGGAVAESFSGTLAANGHLRPENRAAIAWHLAGPLAANAGEASFGGGELRIGGGDNDLVFAAEARAKLTDTPNVEAKLVARQLDIDRLAGAPAVTDGGPAPAPAPPRLPDLAALRGLVAALTPPLPVAVDASVDSAIWGGQALSDIEARFTLGAATPRPVHVAGDGPGGSRLALDSGGGDGRAGGADGRIALSADDLPAAVAWARQVVPENSLPAGAPPFRQVSIAGRFAARDGAVALDGAKLVLDRSTLRGSARLAWPDATGAPIGVAAALATPLLDIDALPELPLRAGAAGTMPPAIDLALKLDADAVRIAQAGSAPLVTGRLHLDARRSARGLAVEALDVADLGGASLRAKGGIAADAATLDLDIDASRVEAAAALLRQLAPGRAAEALAHRAPSLAPAKVHLAAAFDLTGKDRSAPSRLDLAGTLAATALDVHLSPEGDRMHLRASAETPRGEGLLRQIGLPLATDPTSPDPTSPGRRGLGPARLALDGTGPLDGALDTTVEAAFGGSHLAVRGSFQLFGAGRGGSGALTLASTDAVPLLQALGLASTDARNLLPASLTGGLALSQTGVAVSDLKGSVGGDGVAGTLRWRSIDGATPGAPALTGSLDLDRLALGDVAALLLGPPRPAPLAGEAWSSEPFAASLAELPRGLVTLHARTLDLGLNRDAGPTAGDATLEVAVAPDALAVHHLAGTLAGGRIDADGTLRRDGGQATLAGKIALKGIGLDIPALKAAATLHLDVAGSGASPLALVASLAGSGEAGLDDVVLPGFAPQALPDVFTEVESDALAVDAENVKRALAAVDAGQGGVGQGGIGQGGAARSTAGSSPKPASVPPPSLHLGARRLAAGLASGIVSFAPRDKPAAIGPVAVAIAGGYDLRRLAGSLAVAETLTALPKDWSGPPPRTVATLEGLPGTARRSLDVGDFINAVAARAIARETARIETFEFDVRERALFNARLIFDRRREQDRLKVEAEAKAAIEKAQQERAAQERAAADTGKADTGKAEASRADAGRAPEASPQRPAPTVPDPSAAGRY